MADLCALFDMDGTIYDSGIDFLAIRDRLGLPQNGMPILSQLRAAPASVRRRGIRLLHAAEAEGAAHGKLIPGATELLSHLQRNGVRCALITNNSRKSTDIVLAKHPLGFDLVLTRDDGPSKPEPDLFHKALTQFGLRPDQAAAVGDTHLDAIAAHRAGIRAIHLIAVRDWMTQLIPSELAYQRHADLKGLRDALEDWLRSTGPAFARSEPTAV